MNGPSPTTLDVKFIGVPEQAPLLLNVNETSGGLATVIVAVPFSEELYCLAGPRRQM